MRTPAGLPDSLAHRAFRVDEAQALNVSRGRTRRSDLTAPIWGVRTPPTASFWDALSAAGCIIGVDEAFSHDTAARMLGLWHPRVWTPAEPWHVTGENDLSRLRRRHIVAHRSAACRDVVVVSDVRCTDPLTTWADMAGSLSLPELVAMGDSVLGLRDPWSMEALRETVHLRARRRDVLRMREAVSLVRAGSRSAMESATRVLFVRGGLPEPEINAPIYDAAGEWLATGDFVWRRQRVVAEFDGDYHRTDRRQWQRDVARRESVVDAGWTYIQLTARSVTVPAYADRLLARLRRLLL